MTTRLALFDCDGTLVDSGASIHHALDAALRTHGHDVPPRHETKKVIGLSLEQAMAALLPEADHAALAETYKQAFFDLRSAGGVEEPLFDGIADALDKLEADGWLLGVATGKSMRGLRHCLETHGLERRFVTLQTCDTNPSKPHPGMALTAMAEAGTAPTATVFIGDTAWDMGCARAAGCFAMGVEWGYHDVASLIEGGANLVVEDPSQIADMAATFDLGDPQ